MSPETVRPYAEAAASELILILQRQEMHRALLQNVAITLVSHTARVTATLLSAATATPPTSASATHAPVRSESYSFSLR